MKNILKSGRCFIKRKNDIIMYPASKGKEKAIKSDKLEKIWDEMKFIDSNFTHNNYDIYNLLKENGLVYDISESEWIDYQVNSRNIHNLSLYNNKNPYKFYNDIIDKRIMVIGLGTVGSPLVSQLSKFGFKNITVIDGDTIENNNLTAQLNYSKDDINRPKAEVIYERIPGVKSYYTTFVNNDNINNIMLQNKPEFVFCCADDATGKLFELLIYNTEIYNYSLFLTAYSNEEIVVNFITKESKNVFLNYINDHQFLNNSEYISHNTGTIFKGMLSASLVFNSFFRL